jgi:hypothetical protein
VGKGGKGGEGGKGRGERGERGGRDLVGERNGKNSNLELLSGD